ncbi:MAG: ISC system 2Fe-2S type ferredoxin [Moraxella sp.]|nr:ISC system 2Fe-2S type ferredoxin [Moraxella sp.]
MVTVTILPHHEICPEGTTLTLNSGDNLCEGLLAQGVAIEHACDMSKACTTCHVVVRKGFDSLEEMDDIEADLLDRAWGLEPDSRLSCQCIVGASDLVIEIPKYTINHAKEGH